MSPKLVALVVAFLVSAMPVRSPSDESCFFKLVNQERAKVGRKQLTYNPQVAAVARRHSQEMATRETIYHNPNLAEELPPYKAGGENVGQGPDCATIHAAFRNSPGHYGNMIDRDYTQLGVGVYISDDTLYVTEDFFAPAVPSKPRRPAPRPRSTGRCI